MTSTFCLQIVEKFFNLTRICDGFFSFNFSFIVKVQEAIIKEKINVPDPTYFSNTVFELNFSKVVAGS